MNDGVEHLKGKAFFKERAQDIAKSLRKVKSKTKKVGAVKKKAPVKKAPARSYHKDTKSHNVKISVMSGVKEVDLFTLRAYESVLRDIARIEQTIRQYTVYSKDKKYSVSDRKFLLNTLKGYKKYLSELKTHAKELKKLI